MKAKCICFKTRNGFEIVQLTKIIFCVADGSYTIIVTTERKLTVTKCLSKVEKICGFGQLFRSHKSYLVNIKFILKILKNKVQLRNYPDYVLISRPKLKEIYNVLNIRNIKAVT